MEFANKMEQFNCWYLLTLFTNNTFNDGKSHQKLVRNERPGNFGGSGELHSTNPVTAK